MGDRKLQAVTADRQKWNRLFCGPVAIAAVTGKSFEEVTNITGNQGMWSAQITYAIARLGERVLVWEEKEVSHFRQGKKVILTLGKLIQSGRLNDGTFVIDLPRHSFAVSGGEILDNGALFSKTPVPLERFSKSRLHVETVRRIC